MGNDGALDAYATLANSGDTVFLPRMSHGQPASAPEPSPRDGTWFRMRPYHDVSARTVTAKASPVRTPTHRTDRITGSWTCIRQELRRMPLRCSPSVCGRMVAITLKSSLPQGAPMRGLPSRSGDSRILGSRFGVSRKDSPEHLSITCGVCHDPHSKMKGSSASRRYHLSELHLCALPRPAQRSGSEFVSIGTSCS
jgi:hypothetical protein